MTDSEAITSCILHLFYFKLIPVSTLLIDYVFRHQDLTPVLIHNFIGIKANCLSRNYSKKAVLSPLRKVLFLSLNH